MFNRKPRAWLRAGQLGLATLLIGGLAGASGCLERPLKPIGPRSTAVISEKLTQSSVDKIDLLLSIDNSRSMADKQQILALAVPDLVKGLVNPACINSTTGNYDSTPSGPLAKCPDGTQRDFDPVVDIHIGLVTSSLGGHGSDACSTNGMGKESNNDKGHLIDRKDPAAPGVVDTYQGLSFLAWDPEQKLKPPGEGDVNGLVKSLNELVIGAGQIGCGYESQLEGWYRFLIDPSPYGSIGLGMKGEIVLQDLDKTLLDQRKAFLRPDSLLAVIMLTDENDCSLRESGQFYYAEQQKTGNGSPFHLPAARQICDTDPNNDCCYSCGQHAKDADCGEDPTCKDAKGNVPRYLDEIEDNINLRCWNQKRRFGIDFLNPTQRYVDGLKNTTVADRNGQVVPNPIYSDLDPSDTNSNVRTSNLVFLAGLVGVPWQDIARTDANGKPDLLTGLDTDKKPRGGFKNADEMLLPIGADKTYNTWDLVLGDPSKYPNADALPKDPHMIETPDQRSGTNPVTGDAIQPPSQHNKDAINGNEWSIPKKDDLQYACTFDLVKVDASGNIQPDTRDCSTPGVYPACDCEDKANDNPLCEPAASGNPTDQKRAKGYPGLRELQTLKDSGAQGIVASVCPKQMKDVKANDFGYRPAIGAIIDRLKLALGGQCLSRTLTANDKGQVQCLILEASKVENNACNCDTAGHNAVTDGSSSTPDHRPAVDAIQANNPNAGYNCFCEITQLKNDNEVKNQAECQKNYDQAGYNLCACQWTDPKVQVVAGNKEVDGWCYIDATSGIGEPKVVEKCPETEKRLIRFVGAGQAKAGATLFITCTGDTASN